MHRHRLREVLPPEGEEHHPAHPAARPCPGRHGSSRRRHPSGGGPPSTMARTVPPMSRPAGTGPTTRAGSHPPADEHHAPPGTGPAHTATAIPSTRTSRANDGSPGPSPCSSTRPGRGRPVPPARAVPRVVPPLHVAGPRLDQHPVTDDDVGRVGIAVVPAAVPASRGERVEVVVPGHPGPVSRLRHDLEAAAEGVGLVERMGRVPSRPGQAEVGEPRPDLEPDDVAALVGRPAVDGACRAHPGPGDPRRRGTVSLAAGVGAHSRVIRGSTTACRMSTTALMTT